MRKRIVVGGITKWVTVPDLPREDIPKTKNELRDWWRNRLHLVKDSDIRRKVPDMGYGYPLTNELRVRILCGEVKTMEQVKRVKKYRKKANATTNKARSESRVVVPLSWATKKLTSHKVTGWKATDIKQAGDAAIATYHNPRRGRRTYLMDKFIHDWLSHRPEAPSYDEYVWQVKEFGKLLGYGANERTALYRDRWKSAMKYKRDFNKSDTQQLIEFLQFRIEAVDYVIENGKQPRICGRCSARDCGEQCTRDMCDHRHADYVSEDRENASVG